MGHQIDLLATILPIKVTTYILISKQILQVCRILKLKSIDNFQKLKF